MSVSACRARVSCYSVDRRSKGGERRTKSAVVGPSTRAATLKCVGASRPFECTLNRALSKAPLRSLRSPPLGQMARSDFDHPGDLVPKIYPRVTLPLGPRTYRIPVGSAPWSPIFIHRVPPPLLLETVFPAKPLP